MTSLTHPHRIGVMAAMPEELQAWLDAMPDLRPVRLAGRDFWVGHLHGAEVVAVLSRIGKVAAATTTTLLIAEFGVREVWFTGVAGGLGDQVRVGDVVVANALVQHDMDASPLFPRFELPGCGVTRLCPPPERVAEVARVVTQALSPQALAEGGVLGDLAARHLADLGLPATPRVHTGLIVSGDQFIHTAQVSAALREALPDALAVEMEGAAVAQVCHDFDVPYTVLRTVSDRADDDAHLDFPRFIAGVACHYALAMISALLLSRQRRNVP